MPRLPGRPVFWMHLVPVVKTQCDTHSVLVGNIKEARLPVSGEAE